jgi:hypothetical protein
MQSIRSLLNLPAPRQPPAKIASDEVYPVYPWDDNKTLRSIIVTWTMVFDDVLDAEVLKRGLEGVIAREGWMKVGGRIRKGVSLTVSSFWVWCAVFWSWGVDIDGWSTGRRETGTSHPIRIYKGEARDCVHARHT